MDEENFGPTPLAAGDKAMASNAEFSSDRRRLVVALTNGTARLYKPEAPAQGPEIVKLFLPGEAPPTTLGTDHRGLWILNTRPNAEGPQTPIPSSPVLSSGANTSPPVQIARLWDLTSADSNPRAFVLGGPIPQPFPPEVWPIIGGERDRRWLVILFSNGRNGRICLWDLDGQSLSGPPESVHSKDAPLHAILLNTTDRPISYFAISRDGRWLVTAGYTEPEVRLWDLTSPSLHSNNPVPIVLRGHEGQIASLSVSPDSRWLVTTSADGTARIWDLSCLSPVAEPFTVPCTPRANPSIISPSADRHWLAAAGSDGIARLWNLTTSETLDKPIALTGPGETIKALTTSIDGRWLIASAVDHGATLWDLGADDPAANPIALGKLRGDLSQLVTSLDGRWIAASGKEPSAQKSWVPFIELWNRDEPRGPARVVALGDRKAVALALDSRDRLVALRDNRVQLWDLKAEDPSARSITLPLQEGEGRISTVLVSPDRRRLIVRKALMTRNVVQDKGHLQLWDLTAEDPVAAKPVLLDPGDSPSFSALKISFNNRWMIQADEGAGRYWNLEERGTVIKPGFLWGGECSKGNTGSGRFFTAADHTGHWVVEVDSDGATHLYDFSSSKPQVHELAISKPQEPVISQSGGDPTTPNPLISSDGRWLATFDGEKVHLWDLANLKAGKQDDGHAPVRGLKVGANGLAVSADGRWLALSGVDGMIRLWDLKAGDSGDYPKVLPGHSTFYYMASNLFVSPDGAGSSLRTITRSASRGCRETS